MKRKFKRERYLLRKLKSRYQLRARPEQDLYLSFQTMSVIKSTILQSFIAPSQAEYTKQNYADAHFNQ